MSPSQTNKDQQKGDYNIELYFVTVDIPRLWVEDRYTVHFKYDARHWLLHICNSDDPTVTLYIVEYDAKQTVKSVTYRHDTEIGIMIETPASIFVAEELAKWGLLSNFHYSRP